jgi:hypothetical protein
MELPIRKTKPNAAIARKVTNADVLARKIMSLASAAGKRCSPREEP